MRRPVLAANWKMHFTADEVKTFFASWNDQAEGVFRNRELELVFAVPSPYLQLVKSLVPQSTGVGAQNVFYEDKGAFTGEISAPMLGSLGVKYAIVGHSERRQIFGETSQIVAKKLKACLRHGLTAIVCVGESLAERRSERTKDVVWGQLEALYDEVPSLSSGVVIAYEPVWAIGTGVAASAEAAQETHVWIRDFIRGREGTAVAEGLRVVYGGSVNPANVAELMAQPDIDGGLVGGASLDPGSFVNLAAACVRA